MKQVCRNCIYFWGDDCLYYLHVRIRVYSPSKTSCRHFKGKNEQVEKQCQKED